MTVAVGDVAKNLKLITDSDEIVYIEDKRKHQLKSIVIPADYAEDLKKMIEELEYRKFKERNASLMSVDEDETLLDGLDDAY